MSGRPTRSSTIVRAVPSRVLGLRWRDVRSKGSSTSRGGSVPAGVQPAQRARHASPVHPGAAGGRRPAWSRATIAATPSTAGWSSGAVACGSRAAPATAARARRCAAGVGARMVVGISPEGWRSRTGGTGLRASPAPPSRLSAAARRSCPSASPTRTALPRRWRGYAVIRSPFAWASSFHLAPFARGSHRAQLREDTDPHHGPHRGPAAPD